MRYEGLEGCPISQEEISTTTPYNCVRRGKGGTQKPGVGATFEVGLSHIESKQISVVGGHFHFNVVQKKLYHSRFHAFTFNHKCDCLIFVKMKRHSIQSNALSFAPQPPWKTHFQMWMTAIYDQMNRSQVTGEKVDSHSIQSRDSHPHPVPCWWQPQWDLVICAHREWLFYPKGKHSRKIFTLMMSADTPTFYVCLLLPLSPL